METCAAARVSTLAFEAGRTLLLERDLVEAAAGKKKITLAAWSAHTENAPN
jgi:DUF1009 family protein